MDTLRKRKRGEGESTSTNKRSGCDLCCDASFARYIDKTGGREEKKCVIEFDSGDDVVGNVKTVSVSLAGYTIPALPPIFDQRDSNVEKKKIRRAVGKKHHRQEESIDRGR